jgi:hypothetical protein
VWASDTGMPDEKDYKAHLLDYDDAMQKLGKESVDGIVVWKAFDLYAWSLQVDEELEQRAREEAHRGLATSTDHGPATE